MSALVTDASFVRLATGEETAERWQPGARVGWFVADHCKVASPLEVDYYRCRGGAQARCEGRVVMALSRPHGRSWRWWYYCNRIVEDGKVLEMRRLWVGRNG